jgi:hypothetical protein
MRELKQRCASTSTILSTVNALACSACATCVFWNRDSGAFTESMAAVATQAVITGAGAFFATDLAGMLAVGYGNRSFVVHHALMLAMMGANRWVFNDRFLWSAPRLMAMEVSTIFLNLKYFSKRGGAANLLTTRLLATTFVFSRMLSLPFGVAESASREGATHPFTVGLAALCGLQWYWGILAIRGARRAANNRHNNYNHNS